MTDTNNAASNRLPVLAAEIRRAHADVHDAAMTAAQRAIDAGHALIEAKELVAHGQWLPWLRENCALSERTAQLYMKVAASGLKSATIADLGLQAAATAIVGYIDYWSECSAAELVEWRTFALFLAREQGWHIEAAFQHTEWVRRGGIKTPSSWLFEHAPRYFAAVHRRKLPQSLLDAWVAFRDAHSARTREELDAEMQRLCEEQGELPKIASSASRSKAKRAILKSKPNGADKAISKALSALAAANRG